MIRFDTAISSVFMLLAFVGLALGVEPALPTSCMLAALIIIRTRRG